MLRLGADFNAPQFHVMRPNLYAAFPFDVWLSCATGGLIAVLVELLPYPTLAFNKAAAAEAEAYTACADLIRLLMEAWPGVVLGEVEGASTATYQANLTPQPPNPNPSRTLDTQERRCRTDALQQLYQSEIRPRRYEPSQHPHPDLSRTGSYIIRRTRR